MVTVSFDPTLDHQAQSDATRTRTAGRQAGGAARSPRQPFAPDPNDPKYLADQKAGQGKGRTR